MNKIPAKHFYLFKGDWYDLFIELIDLFGNNQTFAIWEPLDKNKKYNLIVVSGRTLPEEYCFDRRIWKTDEDTFHSYYKIEKFNVNENKSSVS